MAFFLGRRQICFKPNYIPKKYAVIILPISGAGISIAVLPAVVEDTVRFKRRSFGVVGDDKAS